jgi:hypothetical protein
METNEVEIREMGNNVIVVTEDKEEKIKEPDPGNYNILDTSEDEMETNEVEIKDSEKSSYQKDDNKESMGRESTGTHVTL